MTEKTEEVKELKEIKTELEEAYRKFLRLYERFAEDRLTVTKQGEALGKIIEQLQAESSMATEFKHHIRDGLKEIIDNATQNMKQHCSKEVTDAIAAEINNSIKELRAAIDKSVVILNDYETARPFGYWMFHLGALAAVLIFGMIFVKLLMPTPLLPLTDTQFQTCMNGQKLESFWSKISKVRREYLLDIGAGKIDPEVNSLKWIQQQHPTWGVEEMAQEFNKQGKQDEGKGVVGRKLTKSRQG